jgi:hypothetical protein
MRQFLRLFKEMREATQSPEIVVNLFLVFAGIVFTSLYLASSHSSISNLKSTGEKHSFSPSLYYREPLLKSKFDSSISKALSAPENKNDQIKEVAKNNDGAQSKSSMPNISKKTSKDIFQEGTVLRSGQSTSIDLDNSSYLTLKDLDSFTIDGTARVTVVGERANPFFVSFPQRFTTLTTGEGNTAEKRIFLNDFQTDLRKDFGSFDQISGQKVFHVGVKRVSLTSGQVIASDYSGFFRVRVTYE